MSGVRPLAQPLALAVGGQKNGDSFAASPIPASSYIGVQPFFEVVTGWNLALLAHFFPETQHALRPVVLPITPAQLGERPDTRPGVGEHPEDGPVAQTHHMGDVDRGEQISDLLDGELGRLSVRDTCGYRKGCAGPGFSEARAERVFSLSRTALK